MTLAFIGDGNNVANSLLLACSMVGINFLIASPEEYSMKDNVLKMANKYAEQSGSQIMLLEEPAMAAKDADVIYTDVWTSMGQEEEYEQRCIAFAKYQVNDKLLSYAKKDAIRYAPAAGASRGRSGSGYYRPLSLGDIRPGGKPPPFPAYPAG